MIRIYSTLYFENIEVRELGCHPAPTLTAFAQVLIPDCLAALSMGAIICQRSTP